MDSAATSESFTARIALPQRLRASSQKPAVPSAASAMLASAMPRSPMPPGGVIPMMPFCPPVTPRHSTAACSTMKPKAIVTIARYGPRTRSAGSASSAPTRPDTTAAAGSAAQKLQLAPTVRIATAYAPSA
jgi:hypothetical protein